MDQRLTINQDVIQQWLEENLDQEKLHHKLQASSWDAEQVRLYMDAFKKALHKKRQTRGFIWTGIGSFLGFVSCVLTMWNPIPELYGWILYGLTSVAIAVICLGLYFIFE